MSIKIAIALLVTSATATLAVSPASAAHLRMVGKKFCMAQDGNNIILENCQAGRGEQNFRLNLSEGDIVTPSGQCIGSTTGLNRPNPNANNPTRAIAGNCNGTLFMQQNGNLLGPRKFPGIYLDGYGTIPKEGNPVHFWNDGNEPTSKWESVDLTAPVPQASIPVPVVNPPIVKPNSIPHCGIIQTCETSRFTRQVDRRYVAILSSVRPGNKWQGTVNVGHSSYAVADVWFDVTYARYSDGSEKEISRVGKSDKITSVEAPGFVKGTATQVNENWGKELASMWIVNQAPKVDRVSFRAHTITKETFQKFSVPAAYKGSLPGFYPSGNCDKYTITPIFGVKGTCNCVSLATSFYAQSGGDRFGEFAAITPLSLSQNIDRANSMPNWWQ